MADTLKTAPDTETSAAPDTETSAAPEPETGGGWYNDEVVIQMFDRFWRQESRGRLIEWGFSDKTVSRVLNKCLEFLKAFAFLFRTPDECRSFLLVLCDTFTADTPQERTDVLAVALQRLPKTQAARIRLHTRDLTELLSHYERTRKLFLNDELDESFERLCGERQKVIDSARQATKGRTFETDRKAARKAFRDTLLEGATASIAAYASQT